MTLQEQYKEETGLEPSHTEPMYTEAGYSFGQDQYPYTNEYVKWLQDKIEEMELEKYQEGLERE